MTAQAHIESITKGPNQRVRRTVGYKVVAGGKEIGRFGPNDLAAAQQMLATFKAKAAAFEAGLFKMFTP